MKKTHSIFTLCDAMIRLPALIAPFLLLSIYLAISTMLPWLSKSRLILYLYLSLPLSTSRLFCSLSIPSKYLSLSLCLSVYLSTYLLTYPSKHLPTHPPIHPSIHPPNHQFIHRSTQTYPPIHPCLHLSTHPIIHPSIHPSVHPSIHPSIHLPSLNSPVENPVFSHPVECSAHSPLLCAQLGVQVDGHLVVDELHAEGRAGHRDVVVFDPRSGALRRHHPRVNALSNTEYRLSGNALEYLKRYNREMFYTECD